MATSSHGPSAPTIPTGWNDSANGGYVQTGNRIQVLVAGHIVGLVQSMQASDDYGVQPATKVGSIEAVEIVPLEANHTINISMMMLSHDTLYQSAKGYRLIPESGNNNPTYNTALKGLEMDIIVRSFNGDDNDGKVLVMYRKCVYASGSIDVTANRIIVAQATFRATHRVGLFRV